MSKSLLTIVGIVTLLSISFAGETPEVTLSAPREEPDLILKAVKDKRDPFKEFDDFARKYPCRGPLPPALGEPIRWLARNTDRWQGWSLTGYSRSGLTKDFKHWRFKIGIVNGEWEAERREFITAADWAYFSEWERQMNSEVVLGVSWTIIF